MIKSSSAKCERNRDGNMVKREEKKRESGSGRAGIKRKMKWSVVWRETKNKHKKLTKQKKKWKGAEGKYN